MAAGFFIFAITIAGGLALGHYYRMEPKNLVWTQEYMVGHKGLDIEHRQLVEGINEICSAEIAECSSDILLSLLNRLTLLAVEHFAHENTVMHEISSSTSHFEAINEHCAHHAEALVALESIILAASPRADSTRQLSGRKLIKWFTEHAIKHDAELRLLFQSNFAPELGNMADRLDDAARALQYPSADYAPRIVTIPGKPGLSQA